MGKFKMSELLSEKSKKERDKSNFAIKNIDINRITPDERNFYNTDEIEELKASIEMLGLQQNLVVKEDGSGGYSLISGHRRLKAMRELVDGGDERFKVIPCKVEENIDDLMSELQLIMANSTARELTNYEKTHQAQKIKELLTELKDKGFKLPGKMRDVVADTLKVSPTQVARMESINNNLSEDFKNEFKEEKVNLSTAYELSGLPEKLQKEAYEEYSEKGKLTIKDVKDMKGATSESTESETELIKADEAEESEVVQETDGEEQLKIYVCSKEGKRFANVEYIKDVIGKGHIPLSANSILSGLSGIEVEDTLRHLAIELITIADEVWVYGGSDGDNTAFVTLVEINAANKLGKKVLYKEG